MNSWLPRFVAVCALLGWAGPASAQSIGNTVSVVPATEGRLGAATRTLTIGDGVSQNEVIRTNAGGAARLKFRDETTLNIGANAQVTLDKFVYNPDQTAKESVITATRGAFRFTTGESDKRAYQIRTPTATIGVRGTVIDFVVDAKGLHIKVVVGEAVVCRQSAGGGAGGAGGRRGCVTLTPASGPFLISATGSGPDPGFDGLVGLLDGVHRRLNIAAGVPLSLPGPDGTGPGGFVVIGDGATPPNPTAGDSGEHIVTPPTIPPLVPGPALGAPPSSPPGDSPVTYAWQYQPGYCIGCSFFLGGRFGGEGGIRPLVVDPTFVTGESGSAPRDTVFVDGEPVNLGTVSRGTAKVTDLFSNSFLTMGRWHNGVVQVTNPAATSSSLRLGVNDGLHFFSGRQTLPGEFPTITAGYVDLSYRFEAATRPTVEGGYYTPGTFYGEAKLRLTATNAFLAFAGHFSVDLGEGSETYSLRTKGGLTNPAQSQVTFKPDSTTSFGGQVDVKRNGYTCDPACVGSIAGTFFGSSHQSLALIYRVTDPDIYYGGTYTGAAVLTRDGAPPEEARAPGPYPGSGDTVLSPRHLVTTGVGSLTGLTTGADGIWLNPAGATYRAGKNGGTVLERHTAVRREAGQVGTGAGTIIAWERWTQGYVGGSIGAQFSGETGVHLVHGKPATEVPTTGTYTYALQGATKPTIRDGSVAPGTFTGQMAVKFGAGAKVGVDAQVGIGGHTYQMKTAGGVTQPGFSQINLNPNATFSTGTQGLSIGTGGPACAGSTACAAKIDGFLAGPGGMYAGIGYSIGGGDPSKVVSGVAGFKR